MGQFEGNYYDGDDTAETVVGTFAPEYIEARGGKDTIQGLGGNDTIYGGAGDDTMSGGTGDDYLSDNDGADDFRGGEGDDRIVATLDEGIDVVDGGTGIDILYLYGSGQTSIAMTGSLATGATVKSGVTTIATIKGIEAINFAGGSGDDTLIGGTGNDTIAGLTGANKVTTGDGDDFISTVIDAGKDVIDAGLGDDTLNLTGDSTPGVTGYKMTVSGSTIDATIGGVSVLHATGIEFVNASGSAGDDYLIGLATTTASLSGQDGNDTLIGGGVGDNLIGGNGDDSIVAGGGADYIDAGPGNNTVLAGTGNDNIYSSNGNDSVSGDDGNDYIASYGGKDTLLGGAGNDAIYASLDVAADTIDGGAGIDVLTLLGSSDAGVVMTGALATTLTIKVGGVVTETIKGIESIQVSGGAGNDILIGGANSDTLSAGAGVDRITAGAGDDRISVAIDANKDSIDGGDGNDAVTFSAGVDAYRMVANTHGGVDISIGTKVVVQASSIEAITAFGSEGDDTLLGLAGDDRLYGNGGNNSISAGAGQDVIYASTGNNKIDAGDGYDYVSVGSGNDTVLGGLGDDTVYASEGNNSVTGGDGSDYISVGAGDDIVSAGAGDDYVYDTGGKNNISTGDNDDQIYGRIDALTDTIDAGAGFDYLSLDNFSDVNGIVMTGSLATTATIKSGNTVIATIKGVEQVSIDATAGNDTVFGGAYGDVLNVYGGINSVKAGDGNDYISAGIDKGKDVIDGGAGNDSLLLSGAQDAFTMLANKSGGIDVNIGASLVLTASSIEALQVYGSALNDKLIGLAGDDYLSGGGGDDTVSAGDGEDTILGGSGVNSLAGGAGDDQFYLTGSTKNTVSGDAGNDQVYAGGGSASNDNVAGGAGNDQIYAGAGADTLSGGDGDDHIDVVLDANKDVITGGAGYDLLSLSVPGLTSLTMTGSLETGATFKSGATTIATVSGISAITVDGTTGNDVLIGGVGNDQIGLYYANHFGLGTDSANTGAGNDYVYLTLDQNKDSVDLGADADYLTVTQSIAGNLVMSGTLANFTVTLGGKAAASVKNLEQINITAGAGNDVLFGGDLGDALDGGRGANTLSGKGGNDAISLDVDTGKDVVDGGDGIDVLFLRGSDTGFKMTSSAATSVDVLIGASTVVHATNIEYLNVQGSESTDTIVGLGSNDALDGNGSDDKISGGAGNDGLTGDAGNDTLDGGADNDNIDAGAGNDSVLGGTGADYILGAGGDDYVNGGDDNDTISGDRGRNTLLGGEGNDSIVAFADSLLDSIDGGGGIDSVTLVTGPDQAIVMKGDVGKGGAVSVGVAEVATIKGVEQVIVNGSNGDDVLLGGIGDDRLALGAGANKATSGAGNDLIYALIDSGADTIDAGADLDTLVINGANDAFTMKANTTGGVDATSLGKLVLHASNVEFITAYGTNFNDSLIGLALNDYLSGYAGNDTLVGNAGSDTLYAGGGDDNLNGGEGNDLLTGSIGAVTLLGGAGDDVINAVADLLKDSIDGGTGNDTLGLSFYGLNGVTMSGDIGSGATVTSGGKTIASIKGIESGVFSDSSGNDVLVGGAGADVFRIQNGGADKVTAGAGNDFVAVNLDANKDVVNGGTGINEISVQAGVDPITMKVTSDSGFDVTIAGKTVLSASAFDYFDIYGSDGNDVLYGLGVGSLLVGYDGDDVIRGGAGRDLAYGGFGNDNIATNAFADYIEDYYGQNTITAGTGDDVVNIALDPLKDSVDGGAGYDGIGISFSDFNSPVTMTGNFQTGVTIKSNGGLQTAFVKGFEYMTIRDTTGNDVLLGAEGTDTILGGQGADKISTGAGDDHLVLSLDSGADTIDLGAGSDEIFVTAGGLDAVVMSGTIGNVKITFAGKTAATIAHGEYVSIGTGAGNDVLFGGAISDELYAYGGANTINGNAGGDFMGVTIDTLRDLIDGGDGIDELDLDGRYTATAFKMTATSSHGVDVAIGASNVVHALNVETLAVGGSAYNDTLAGLALDDYLQGNAGNDSIAGGAGDDYLVGGAGDDVLNGGDGDDFFVDDGGKFTITGGAGVDTVVFDFSNNTAVTLGGDVKVTVKADGIALGTLAGVENVYAGDGNDTITGDTRDNVISGGRGDNILDGGAGNDTVDFTDNSQAVTVTLLGAKASIVTFGDETTSIKNFENVITGSYADSIVGDDAANKIHSGFGSDTIDGKGGNDYISMGYGLDVITTGAGNDTVAFDDYGSFTFFGGNVGNVKTITDFSALSDTFLLDTAAFPEIASLNLKSIGLYTIGSGTQGSDDYVVYNKSTGELFLDDDANGVDAGVLFATIKPGTNLSDGNFVVTNSGAVPPTASPTHADAGVGQAPHASSAAASAFALGHGDAVADTPEHLSASTGTIDASLLHSDYIIGG